MQKLKQPALKGIQIHNQREKESHTNPDIDSSKSNLNYDLVNDQPLDYSKTINEMLQEGVTTGKTVRKDAVRACSFLVTSDKDFFSKLSEADEKRFFESAYRYLADKYGEKNIAYASVHKDEKTPHMHVGLVPITDDGRLSAKDFFGKKHQLVELQDGFQEHMKAAGFDLERGVSSDRKHIESSRFKAITAERQLADLESKIDVLNNKVADLSNEVSHKDGLIKQQKKELVSNKVELDGLERELKRRSGKLDELKEKIEKLEEPLKQLDKVEIKHSRITNKITLKKEDYETIKGWAEQGFFQKKNEKNLAVENKNLRMENEQLSTKNQHLSNDNDKLFSERAKLRKENKSLQRDVLKFKQLYEFAKEILQRLNIYDQVKGFFEKKEKEVVQENRKELER